MNKYLLKIIFIFISASLFSQDLTTDKKAVTGESAGSVQQQTQTQTVGTVKKDRDGWDYYAEGNYTASIKALEEEKKLFPTRINIYIILGWNYKILKNYQEMEKVSLEGYSLSPTHINILRNLGEAYFYQNKFVESIKYLEKYLKYKNRWDDPSTYQIYYLAGYAYLKTGSLYKADVALSASNYVKPNNVQNLLALGEVNEKLSKVDVAISLYESVLKIDPVNADAKNGLLRLKKG